MVLLDSGEKHVLTLEKRQLRQVHCVCLCSLVVGCMCVCAFVFTRCCDIFCSRSLISEREIQCVLLSVTMPMSQEMRGSGEQAHFFTPEAA